ncbi:MAG: SET domain-containing protein [Candidatus Dormibacteria bacterium]
MPGRGICVRESDIHGRGVFATAPIAIDEVIELCPVLRVPEEQVGILDATRLFEYYFAWEGDAGVALGFGSLYNHSSAPNAVYRKDFAADVVEIRARSDIAAGEEITFDYSGISD